MSQGAEGADTPPPPPGGNDGHPGNLGAEPPRVGQVLQDGTLLPPSFSGAPSEDPLAWAQQFERYIVFRQLGTRQAAHLFPLLLRDVALGWFNDEFGQKAPEKIDEVLIKFRNRFITDDTFRWKQRGEIWDRRQRVDESVNLFVSDMRRRAARLALSADELRDVLIHCLRPDIRAFVVQKEPKSCGDVYKYALLAEATVGNAATSSSVAAQLDANMAMMRKLESKLDRMTLGQVASVQFSGEATGRDSSWKSRSRSRSREYGVSNNTRQSQDHGAGQKNAWSSRSYDRSQSPRGHGNSRSQYSRDKGRRPEMGASAIRNERPPTCSRCARRHQGRCFAENLVCRECGVRGHLARTHNSLASNF